MGGATKKDWPKRPSDSQLQEARKKDSDRAITPAAEVGCVPAHLALPGSLQAKRCATVTLNSHWGRAVGAGSLRSCPTLSEPVDCGLPGFSVRERGSLGKSTGVYSPTPF